ncbi:oligosaccharide flippase family protein [Halomonas casei]|uniref:oligosaccharide flippase family protein n=1 Tax=Halomonas casei TaxID=2742613 RepID=UPI003CED1FB6
MSKNKSIRAISFLWLGSLLGAGCAFLIQVILARTLGRNDFGIFASALATVTLMVPLAGFGIAPYWLKIFGEEGWNGQRWWHGSFRFASITTILALVALFSWGELGPVNLSMKIALWMLLPYLFGQVVLELVSGKLQLEEKYTKLAMWQFSPHFFRLLLISISVIFLNESIKIHQAIFAHSFISIVLFCFGIASLKATWNGKFDLKGHGEKIAKLHNSVTPSAITVAKGSWPFGADAFFYLVFFQSGIILLQYFDGPQSAGVYNTAFIIISAIYLFPSAIYQKFLIPKLHRWANQNIQMLSHSYNQGNRYMLIFGIAAFVMILANSWWALPLIFGEEYSEAVKVLNILAVGVPIRFVSTSAGSILITKNNIKLKVKNMAAAALCNIVLATTMIPTLGITGVAIASVISDALLLCLYLISVKTHVFK